MISYKMPVAELKTVRDYRDLLAESMFLQALNQRFFKISCRKDPPFFSCSASADILVDPLKACTLTSSCKEKGTIKALESMLIEVKRSRLCSFYSFIFDFYWHLCFRLQGYDYMAFQNVKYLLFELNWCRGLNLPIWSVIRCTQQTCAMNIYKYILILVLK